MIERGKIIAKNGTPDNKIREKRKEISPNEERNLKQAKKIEGGVSTSESERETGEEEEVFQRSTKVKRSPVERRKKEEQEKEITREDKEKTKNSKMGDEVKAEITMEAVWNKLGEMTTGIIKEIKDMRVQMEAKWKAIDEKVDSLGTELLKKIEEKGEEQERNRKRGEERLMKEIEEEREQRLNFEKERREERQKEGDDRREKEKETEAQLETCGEN